MYYILHTKKYNLDCPALYTIIYFSPLNISNGPNNLYSYSKIFRKAARAAASLDKLADNVPCFARAAASLDKLADNVPCFARAAEREGG
jgi:hypothetical protein